MSLALQLSPAERAMLQEMLTIRIGELRQEVHHSKVTAYREQLKQTEELVKGLLAKVEAAGSEAES
jgi:hypothetical protein